MNERKKQMDVEAELVDKQKENPSPPYPPPPALQNTWFTSAPAAGQAAKT